MQNGFYNYNSVRSVIEFTCSNQTIVSIVNILFYLISFEYLKHFLILSFYYDTFLNKNMYIKYILFLSIDHK